MNRFSASDSVFCFFFLHIEMWSGWWKKTCEKWTNKKWTLKDFTEEKRRKQREKEWAI